MRDAELRRIPDMLVVGEREAREGTVAVREHHAGDTGSASVDELAQRLVVHIRRRASSATATATTPTADVG